MEETLANNQEEISGLLEEETGNGLVYSLRRMVSKLGRLFGAFEERHPLIFFGSASVFVFVVIVSVVSLFFGGNKAVQQAPTSIQTVVVQPATPRVGAALGIDTARLLSNKRVVQELISPMSRLSRGGLLTAEVSNPVASLLVTVRNIEQLLNVDVVAALAAGSANRTDIYNTYVNQLTILEQRSSILYSELTRQHQINSADIQTATKQRGTDVTTLNTLLASSTSQAEINKAVERYQAGSEQLFRKQSDDVILTDALDSSRADIEAARLRLGGMIANRDALIQGITVINIDGDGLQLEKQGVLAEYYKSSVDLGHIASTNRPSPLLVTPTVSQNSNTESTGIVLGGTPLRPIFSSTSTYPLPPLKVLGLEEAYSTPSANPFFTSRNSTAQ